MQSPKLDPPLFADTPTSLSEDVAEIREKFNHVLDTIVQNVDPESASFENTIAPMAFAEGPLAICGQRTQLLESASSDENVRNAARDAHLGVCKIYQSWNGRQDLFKRVETVYENLRTAKLDVQSERLTERWYQYFQNEGAKLEGADKAAFQEINERINTNRSEFRSVLNETKDSLWLTEDELAGVSKSVVDAWEQQFDTVSHTQKFRLPLKSNTVKIVLVQLHNEQVRKKIFEGLEKSAADALAPFTEVLRARRQKAKLLGYKSWAEKCLSQKMAGNPEVVQRFLATLREKLTPLAKKELAYLQSLKRAHNLACESQGEDADGYYLWDQPYYNQQHLMQLHQLDSRHISEYFPVEPTLKGMLKIFEDLFSISIVEVDESSGGTLTSDPAALIWHPDVKMFLVWDTKTDTSEANFIGYLYADLYERTGKYAACANFNIHPGFTDAQGYRHPCATALLTNFHPPAPGRPALLQQSNVVQMFHELGHAMHDLFSRTKYAELHGHRVPADFVEMPSQMLENWCWLPSELSSISMHCSHISPECAQAWKNEHGKEELPPVKLPRETAAKLAASRGVDLALSSLRQIVYAEFDMFAYGEQRHSEKDLKRWWHDKRAEIGLIPGSAEMAEDPGHPFANTIHFVDGSASNYYAYLFSQVHSSDIYHSAFEQNPRDAAVGHRYRRLILEPGGSLDPMDMMREFLGRDPKEDSFLLDIGLDV